jgi:hypothetical protein
MYLKERESRLKLERVLMQEREREHTEVGQRERQKIAKKRQRVRDKSI